MEALLGALLCALPCALLSDHRWIIGAVIGVISMLIAAAALLLRLCPNHPVSKILSSCLQCLKNPVPKLEEGGPPPSSLSPKEDIPPSNGASPEGTPLLPALAEVYFKEGGTLSLKPDHSMTPKPIPYIRWKKDSNLVVDWNSPDMKYYGVYEDRTRLNTETLQLDIHHLTLADSGTFSVETDEATVGTYPVKVI